MNYVEEIEAALMRKLPGLDPELAKLYALVALIKNYKTTLMDVHDAWAVWCNRTKPDHKSLIPFIDLSPEIQELDRPYMEAIHEVCMEVGLGC